MKYSFIILVLIITACSQVSDKQSSDESNQILQEEIGLESMEKSIKKVFFNLPSPIELTQTILSSKHSFNSDLLNNIKNANNYNSSVKKALNFGVYGTDLCYCRVYDQLQESINYLSVIREISDDLQIPEEDGTNAIDRIEKNLSNRDSIFRIIADTYAEADSYLKENQRNEVAVYILVGGWIEGMFFATNIAKENNKNEEIMHQIAEQKFSLSNLVILIRNYANNPIISEIIPHLNHLNKIYEEVNISYEKPIVVTDNETNITTINNEAKVSISDEQIQEITKIVDNIRSIIIS